MLCWRWNNGTAIATFTGTAWNLSEIPHRVRLLRPHSWPDGCALCNQAKRNCSSTVPWTLQRSYSYSTMNSIELSSQVSRMIQHLQRNFYQLTDKYLICGCHSLSISVEHKAGFSLVSIQKAVQICVSHSHFSQMWEKFRLRDVNSKWKSSCKNILFQFSFFSFYWCLDYSK